jgi:hypothetical protein
MASQDRLGWAAGLTFEALGVRIGVRVSDASILPHVERRLPQGARVSAHQTVDQLYSIIAPPESAGSALRRFHIMYAGSMRVTRTLMRSELLADVERHLEQAVIAGTPDKVFLHAGVVGWQGRAIVLPGASRAGKTTLVAALLRAGATYFSDEYAVLDRRGRVHPYPRPLRIRVDGDVSVDEIPAATLGRPGSRPLPIGMVALLGYGPRRRWRAEQLSPARAMLDLLGHAPAARLAPELALATLRIVAERALVVKGTRGEVEEAVPMLLSVIADGRPPCPK